MTTTFPRGGDDDSLSCALSYPLSYLLSTHPVNTASRDIAEGEELLIDFIEPSPDNDHNNRNNRADKGTNKGSDNDNNGNDNDNDNDDQRTMDSDKDADVVRRYVPSQPGQFGSYCLA